MEEKKRSLAKAISWRFLAVFVTAGIVWLLTGRADFAATVGILDSAVKLLVYYCHERLWLKISFGKSRPPEYQI